MGSPTSDCPVSVEDMYPWLSIATRLPQVGVKKQASSVLRLLARMDTETAVEVKVRVNTILGD